MKKNDLKLNINSGGTISVIAFFSLLFLVNPTISVILLYVYMIARKNVETNSRILYYFSCFITALYIGCINSTKSPYNDPDLTWYIEGYLNAGKIPFFKYISTFGINGQGRELAFPTLNYILFIFVGPHSHIYIIIYSLVSYFLLSLSLLTFCKKLNINNLITVSCIFLMAFIPYIFTLSAVVLRQFFAGSILMYILVQKSFYNKKSWGWAIVMVLSHTSSLFFIPFIYLPFFDRYISKKTLFYYALGFGAIVFIQQIASVFSSFFSTDSVVGYALARASTNTTFQLEPLSISKIIFLVFIVMLPIYIIYIVEKSYKYNKAIIRFVNVLMILVLFILINLNQIELTVRYNFYSWLFFPFIFAFASKQFKILNELSPIITLVVIFLFLFTLNNGMWVYKIDNIFTNSFFYYL